MKAKKRLEIIYETQEITRIIFNKEYSSKVFCQSCQAETRHLTVSEVAVIAKVSEVTVFRLAEEGLIHSTESEDGRLLICMNSESFLRKIN